MALLLALWACGSESPGPEDRIRALIDAMEASVEDGSIRQAAELLDAGYSDRWHADRRMAVRSLFGYMQRHRDIHLFTFTDSVELTPRRDAAQALVYVAMTAVPVESMEALVSLKADLFRFKVQLRLVDGQWRIVSSEWERVDPGAL